ncbi:MAG: TIGR04282 family arsenosugar biosynthesis glycosyltransferase [Limnobacter sp.]|nr:TIGR04282 family arsenosugar biosynthesis glycosyltransferase [Limnobacter sp.]
MDRICVGIFAKFPEAGRVKTRLAPLLGFEDCARLAEFLLLSTLDRLSADAPFTAHADLILWTDGGSEQAWKALLRRSKFNHECVQRMPQIQGHLGMRMHHATQQQLSLGVCSVLIGPDAIALQASEILHLADASLQSRVAFIPAEDGGYVAVACRDLIPTLFSEDIPWGTSTVAKITQRRLLLERVQAVWLSKQPDLDEPEDYKRAMDEGLLPQHWKEMYAP